MPLTLNSIKDKNLLELYKSTHTENEKRYNAPFERAFYYLPFLSFSISILNSHFFLFISTIFSVSSINTIGQFRYGRAKFTISRMCVAATTKFHFLLISICIFSIHNFQCLMRRSQWQKDLPKIWLMAPNRMPFVQINIYHRCH